jgi:hypothetical protein
MCGLLTHVLGRGAPGSDNTCRAVCARFATAALESQVRRAILLVMRSIWSGKFLAMIHKLVIAQLLTNGLSSLRSVSRVRFASDISSEAIDKCPRTIAKCQRTMATRSLIAELIIRGRKTTTSLGQIRATFSRASAACPRTDGSKETRASIKSGRKAGCSETIRATSFAKPSDLRSPSERIRVKLFICLFAAQHVAHPLDVTATKRGGYCWPRRGWRSNPGDRPPTKRRTGHSSGISGGHPTRGPC